MKWLRRSLNTLRLVLPGKQPDESTHIGTPLHNQKNSSMLHSFQDPILKEGLSGQWHHDPTQLTEFQSETFITEPLQVLAHNQMMDIFLGMTQTRHVYGRRLWI